MFSNISFGILYVVLPMDMKCATTFETFLSQTLKGMQNGNMTMLLQNYRQEI